MGTQETRRIASMLLAFLWAGSVFCQETPSSSVLGHLPELPGWSLSEAPRVFSPGTLFEYIDGAAENYLSYGFLELVVGDFKKENTAAALTVEIYDMGEETRAFGIYGSERYPESQFLEIGSQGYLEEGMLNFIVGKYYVKLLCFDCGENAEPVLKSAAARIVATVPAKSSLPPLLRLFPRDGLVANSEKFILQNVLGFSFLHHGYLADYRVEDQEFELFIIQGTDAEEAEEMLAQYLESQRRAGQPAQRIPLGYHVKDRYSQNIFLRRTGPFILGAMRIKDGHEDLGKTSLQRLAQALEK